MSQKQDKATTERHAKSLKELLKRPENKVCADCKRNDPRWASWNLGVFLCIRCSGIHRSMGTHISKVKSVDLDMWTVEQMNSIQKWGNKRANTYWEAHLKPGHIPPDHKMESFIRSKYESRRWAMEGPPPSDPAVLEDGASVESPGPEVPTLPSPSTSRPTHTVTASSSSLRAGITNRQPQPHQLISATVAGRAHQASPLVAPHQQPAAPAPAPAPAAPTPANDLFSLDFHNPTPPAATPAPKKDVKQDILSLFSTAPQAAASAQPQAFGQFGGMAAAPPQQNVWGQFSSAAPAAAAPMQQVNAFASTGAGMWGAPQPNMWASSAPQPAQPQQQSLFNTNDVWASPGTANAAGGNNLFASTSLPAKKDDVFGDIWGGFK